MNQRASLSHHAKICRVVKEGGLPFDGTLSTSYLQIIKYLTGGGIKAEVSRPVFIEYSS